MREGWLSNLPLQWVAAIRWMAVRRRADGDYLNRGILSLVRTNGYSPPMRLIKCVALGIAGIIFGQMPAQARAERIWTFDELRDTSDIVAIIEPIKTENNDAKLAGWDEKIKWYQGLTTTFKVHCYLVGKPTTNESAEIVVKYFTHIPHSPGPPNELDLMSFPIGVQTYEISKRNDKESLEIIGVSPHWLAFLKRMGDGTYAPVSGQENPTCSFEQLYGGSFFNPF